MFRAWKFWRDPEPLELYRPPGGAGRDRKREELMETTGHGSHGHNNG